MKSTDKRMNEVLGRARTRQAATRRRRQQMLAVGGGVASIAIVVIASMFAASVGVFAAPVLDGPYQLMASVFSNGAALGYVAVGLLGLMLGVAVTVLAYKVGRQNSARFAPYENPATRPGKMRSMSMPDESPDTVTPAAEEGARDHSAHAVAHADEEHEA